MAKALSAADQLEYAKGLKELYDTFKTADPKKVEKANPKELAKKLYGSDDAKSGLQTKIFVKAIIASKNFDDFLQHMENNELPPTKLTAEEMETLKGGNAAKDGFKISLKLLSGAADNSGVTSWLATSSRQAADYAAGNAMNMFTFSRQALGDGSIALTRGISDFGAGVKATVVKSESQVSSWVLKATKGSFW